MSYGIKKEPKFNYDYSMFIQLNLYKHLKTTIFTQYFFENVRTTVFFVIIFKEDTFTSGNYKLLLIWAPRLSNSSFITVKAVISAES